MTYLLDANVFITAKNLHYAFAIVPGFWEWIEKQHEAGQVFTVRSVAEEVEGGADDLADWMKRQPDSFKLDIADPDLVAMRELAAWASDPQQRFTPAAIDTFLRDPDYFLVAQAKASGHVVVTHETSDLASRKRVKIPDACNAVGVRSIGPFRMLGDEGARFTL